jgi:hypothetical protein
LNALPERAITQFGGKRPGLGGALSSFRFYRSRDINCAGDAALHRTDSSYGASFFGSLLHLGGKVYKRSTDGIDSCGV